VYKADFFTARETTMKWGPWTFNTKHISLDHAGQYDIALSTCTSSADVLDWIAQVASKSWADDATLAHLVRAFDDVLMLQANYCGNGEDREADGEALGRQYMANPNRLDDLLE
jgi:hypothetical protein